METNKNNFSFLDSDQPINFSSSKNSGITALAIRYIDTDYRMAMLADMPKAAEKLLAKQFLTQLAIGNASLNSFSNIAKEQGDATRELKNLNSISSDMNLAIKRGVEEHSLIMEEGFSNLLDSFQEASSENNNLLTDLLYEVRENSNQVVSSIDSLSFMLNQELFLINSEIVNCNTTLKRIENILLSPSETKVKELISRTSHLIKEGVMTHGKWRYENYKDALTVLGEANTSSIGNTNGIVWFQFGYLIWQCNKNHFDQSIRKAKMIEARDAFERAARLFTVKNYAYFVKALRHEAHLQYLLNDFYGAEKTLLNIRERDVDTSYELARYKAKLGKFDEALYILEECLLKRPSLAISVFGEPDFSRMRSLVVLSIINLRDTVNDWTVTHGEQIFADLKLVPQKGLTSGTFGSVKSHKIATLCMSASKNAKDFTTACNLNLKVQEAKEKMKSEETNNYELAQIFALWGMHAESAKILVDLIDIDHKIILSITSDDVFAHVLPLIKGKIDNYTSLVQRAATHEVNRLEKAISSVVTNYVHYGVSRTESSAYLELLRLSKNVSCMNYSCAQKIKEKAIELHISVFNKQRSEWLGHVDEKSLKISPVVVDPTKKDNYTQIGITSASFLNIILLYKSFPEFCGDEVSRVCALYDALLSYNAASENSEIFKLSQLNQSGLGTNLRFYYRATNKHDWLFEDIYLPHRVESRFIGSKTIKFKYGDRIPFKTFMPTIFNWLKHEKMKDILLILKDSTLFS